MEKKGKKLSVTKTTTRNYWKKKRWENSKKILIIFFAETEEQNFYLLKVELRSVEITTEGRLISLLFPDADIATSILKRTVSI